MAIALLTAAPDNTPYGLSTGNTIGSPRPRPAPVPAPDHAPPPAPGPACRPNVLAVPDRTCSTDADCTTVTQVVSCCGTIAVRGINTADVARFQAEDRRCNPGRHCGCAEGPPQLDDGTSQRDHRRPVTVACVANQCTSSLGQVPPPPPSPPIRRLTSAEAARLPACAPAACGPAPLYPTGTCSDGVSQFGRGPCVRLDGVCRWAHLSCP